MYLPINYRQQQIYLHLLRNIIVSSKIWLIIINFSILGLHEYSWCSPTLVICLCEVASSRKSLIPLFRHFKLLPAIYIKSSLFISCLGGFCGQHASGQTWTCASSDYELLHICTCMKMDVVIRLLCKRCLTKMFSNWLEKIVARDSNGCRMVAYRL